MTAPLRPLALLLAVLAPAAGAQEFRLQTLGGEARHGSLEAWDPAGAGTPVVAGRPAPDWFLLERRRPAPRGETAAAGPPWELGLAGGGWLPGRPGPGSGDLALWRTAAGLGLPVDTLWVRRVSRVPGLPPAALEKDRLLLPLPGGGWDRLDGWLLAWEEDGLRFEDAAGARHFPWERVAALDLVDEPVEGEEAPVWLLLRPAGHLPVRVLGAGPEGLRVALPWGGALEIAWEQVAGLARKGGGVTELDRLPLLERTGPESPVLDWRPRVGRSISDRPLRAGGRVWPTGFGTRAPARIRLRLPEPGLLLVAIAVDDEVLGARRPSPVRFRILLDGERLHESRPRSAGEEPVWLRVALPRAGILTLETEPAGPLPFGTHGDWLCPLLVPEAAGRP